MRDWMKGNHSKNVATPNRYTQRGGCLRLMMKLIYNECAPYNKQTPYSRNLQWPSVIGRIVSLWDSLTTDDAHLNSKLIYTEHQINIVSTLFNI